MFLQHLKFAFRNIFRSKIYSLFNIVGFALGFTVCIISGLYIYREFSVDKCYENYPDVYRIVDDENNISAIDYDIAERLRDRFPEIKSITPVLYNYTYEYLIKHAQKEEFISVRNVISTENGFFTLFPSGFIAGNSADPFDSKLAAVVTQSLAERLFGRTDVVGETISTMGGIPISAVIEDMPENSSMRAEILVNSATGRRFTSTCKGGNEICYNPYPIYALLNEGADAKLLEEKINSNLPENLSDTKKIRLQPVTDIYFDKTVTDSQNLPGSRSLVFIFITIAGTVLILSVINYVNFALSQQLNTLKQLGVKMTYGASLKQLRAYYLVEIGLSVFLSFLFSLVIGIYSIPLFEHILGVPLDIRNMLTPVFLVSIPSALAIVVLISALTPFYIISKFDIQMLFGRKQTYFGKQRGKLILTGCQIGITVVMFVCLFMLQKQLNYVKQYDLGFEKEHLIRIEIPDRNGAEAFRNEIAQYNFVQNMVSSGQAPGFMSAWEEQVSELNNRQIKINKIYTEPGFLETFNLQLLQGRRFTDADREAACIISEETMRQLGWNDIEGKTCNGFPVIGVVKDFNISSLHNRMEPVNIIPLKKENITGAPLSIHMKGDVSDAMDKLRLSWKNVFPGKPFDFRFYDEVFDAYYEKEERQSTAIAVISFITIIITCMGLIGQVKQISISKAKEIGIRKINGATIAQIMLVIPNSFFKCFAVAFVLAVPIAWYAINQWLQNFAYKTTISWWIFALSGAVVFLILSLFILLQTWKSATTNPVDILKIE